ncbi:MAG TPA: thiamine pyrophosphate-binding protein [Candidatus Omnitrophota bacterium]|nr:thiamine pyrophosphate-binding protein [Candidatus Omnitrophota bacterium]HPS19712.1 thiamine pyrophosphate-binding protein [Candidatus Omnitrophota bacterium]
MKIGEYLIQQIYATGTRHVFGIQGDYVLNFYAQLCKSPLKVINTCDEQGAGFAADAYARVTGFGVACVTYGVGGLKLANSTAQAFAELSPVLIISGAPGMCERKHDPLLHHKIKSFETQVNVFREMTCAQAVLGDPKNAADEINRVIGAIKETKRPGYIEIPRDMVDVDIDLPKTVLKEKDEIDNITLEEALGEVIGMIKRSKNPIVMIGVEVHRYGLQTMALDFIERTGLPFVTGILGKSAMSENHPQFIGVYVGGMSPDDVRDAVEKADCLIAIGPYLTDLATGIFTHHIDPGCGVVMMPDKIIVKHHSYEAIGMKSLLEALIKAMPEKKIKGQPKKHELIPFIPKKGEKITVKRLFECINTILDDNTTVIAEPGDALFGALDIRVHGMAEFLSPAYYASLGFSIPAAIGVQLASPDRRPLVLIGDGSFQMTGTELSVCVRYGLSPIVVVMNNGGYGTFRSMIDGEFNDIQSWNYADMIRLIGGGKGYVVFREDELVEALEHGKNNYNSPTVIDVRLEKYDTSDRLKKLAETLKQKVKQ